MKKLYILIALIIGLLFLSSCGEKVNTIELHLPKSKVSLSQATKQDVIPTSSKIEILVGEVLTYGYDSNSSVGNTTEYSLKDNGILKEQESDYKSECDMPGCGSSTMLYFQAKEVGNTTITVKNIYRGTVWQEHTFMVKVKLKNKPE